MYISWPGWSLKQSISSHSKPCTRHLRCFVYIQNKPFKTPCTRPCTRLWMIRNTGLQCQVGMSWPSDSKIWIKFGFFNTLYCIYVWKLIGFLQINVSDSSFQRQSAEERLQIKHRAILENAGKVCVLQYFDLNVLT